MSTLVNVCGPSRSGTTMVDLMLGSGDDAFSCGIAYYWFRPWRLGHFRHDPPPEWERVKRVKEHRFHRRAAEDRDVDFVIDSSKDKPWLFDAQRWARASGMTAYNLLL